MKLGIIGAMEVEVCSLIRMMEQSEVYTIGGTEYHEGTLFGVPCVVARSGIGKVAAAVCAQTMILRFCPDLIVNTGVGGALSKELHVCDIAISKNAVQYDMDTSALGDPVGLISGINRIFFDADEGAAQTIEQIARGMGVHTVCGTICSGDRFVASAKQKEEILSHFPGGVACEMEGAAIAHVAFLSSTPFVIVRAISDSADGLSHMDYPTFLSKAAKTSFDIICAFIRSLGD